MQRQSRSLGDDFEVYQRCGNECHRVVASDGRASIQCRHICQLAVER